MTQHARSALPPCLPGVLLRSQYARLTVGLVMFTTIVMAAWLIWSPATELQLASYAPLHMLLEMASIVVCILVFLVSRTVPDSRLNRNMAVVGAAFLGVALLHFMHAMSYQGMPAMITPSGAEKAIHFWLAARLLAAGVLVHVAFANWERQITPRVGNTILGAVMLAVGIATAVFLFRPHWLPATFIPGQGLTAFKIVAELVIVALWLGSAWGFYLETAKTPTWHEAGTRHDPAALLSASIVMGAAELFFTIYTDVNGLFNVLGHIYKVIGAWFIFRGLVSVNLQELDTRCRLALEAARLGVWSWEVESDRVEWDTRAATRWGMQPHAFPTMSALDEKIHPEDRAAKQAALTKALDPHGDGHYQAQYRIITGEGRGIRHIESRGKTQFKDGKPVRVIGVGRDVTEHIEAESSLRHSEARLSAILSISAEAIIAIDDNHRIVIFNEGAEATFGYTASEIVGQPLDMLLPDRFHRGHTDHIRRFAASPDAARRMGARREIFGIRRSGREFPAEASISKIDVGGERTYTVVLRDITSQKQAEAALINANKELEDRVAARTRELSAEMQRREEAQAALSRSQRMEAFGQLAGGIAHDFNNLLTVISGNQELLEMRLEDEKSLALLKRAQNASEMGARLTARLLTFARRRQLEPTVIDLNEQIVGMVELLRRSIGEDITLTTTLAPRLWKVKADASEVENAILNLTINARDAMPSGGSIVIETSDCAIETGEVGGANTLPTGDYVRISVSDTGAGMAPEVVQRAFEPFFTTKAPGKGTGLGLSTIYGFAQQSGGTATIYSEPGHGTTVSIYLPRADAPVSPSSTIRPAVEIPLGSGQTILLVEDNVDVREVTRQRLEGLGYKVLEASAGPAALIALQTPGVAIDLVLSDIVMPGGMSGYDVAHWVETNRPGIKVLLSSGYPDVIARTRPEATPAIKLLRKPYSRAGLAHALRDALGS